MTAILLTGDFHYGFDEYTHDVLDSFLTDISFEPFDIMIIAGDVISHLQSQWPDILGMIRRYINQPILIVLGNHDYWDKKRHWDFFRIRSKQLKLFKDYNIHYLENDGPYETDDLIIYGFDGWYGSGFPPSADCYHISKRIEGVQFNDWFYYKARNKLDSIPEKGNKRQIVVTHFEPNDQPMGASTQWLDTLKDKCDVLCTGHTHRKNDFMHNNMRVLNAGSEYNDPRLMIFKEGEKQEVDNHDRN